jgi:hypothetical protein
MARQHQQFNQANAAPPPELISRKNAAKMLGGVSKSYLVGR